MWVVEPDSADDGSPFATVIHLDTVIRAAHLLPIFGAGFVSKTLTFADTLDAFRTFYVNKYVDHHAFEIAFWITILTFFLADFWYLALTLISSYQLLNFALSLVVLYALIALILTYVPP
jgi:hypothetical protein